MSNKKPTVVMEGARKVKAELTPSGHLLILQDPDEFHTGEQMIEIPPELVASFLARLNKIAGRA